MLADSAQMSGGDTAATREKRNWGIFHWRILVSSINTSPFRHAHNVVDVGGDFRFFVKSPWVSVAGKSFPWANNAPTYAKHFPRTLNLPSRH